MSLLPSSCKSKTNLPAGFFLKINYGVEGNESHASGIVYTDKVDIGGISISNQAVELAQELSPSFLDDVTDGLLGLARMLFP